MTIDQIIGAVTPLKIATAVFVALDAFAIALAVWRSHGVERTLAWVFAILAFPAVGSIFYLTLASPSVTRTTRRKRLSRAAARQAIARRTSFPDTPEKNLTKSMLQLSSSLTGLPPSAGNRVELLTENVEAFERMRSSVLGAKKSIWAEYYIIRNDQTGHRFLDALAAKAREGVEVRLLYDAVGSMGLSSKRLKSIRRAGGEVEAFLPVNPLRRRWSVHLRNHRKMIIVDGNEAFTGGMNIGDEYSGRARWRGGRTFHDTHLAVEGPTVHDLALIFAEDWMFATDETLEMPPETPACDSGGCVVSIVPSGPDQEQNAIEMVYFAGVASARYRVWLSSPYFIPDEPTITALVSAAMRGVDVRVLVPAKCDVAMVGPAARSYYPALIRGGVRVFEYLPSMLHAKTMVVDGSWGIVGSANVDIRSFRLNFELGALVADPKFAENLEKRFLSDLEDSCEVTAQDLAGRGFLRRLGYGAIRLLSPLL